jgi:hypothetical protein
LGVFGLFGKPLANQNGKQKRIVSSRDSARAKFFRAIKRRAPAVLSSLKSDVLPLYTATVSPEPISEYIIAFDLAMLPENLAEMASRDMVGNEKLEKEHLGFFPPLYQANARFELALCKWGKCYHLTDEWIFSEALKTLNLWYYDRNADSWACESEAYAPDVEMYDHEQAFNFTFDPWDAAIDTQASYKKKVSEEFTARLKDYCERMKESHGKGKAYDSRSHKHFRWLVEHQINGRRYEEIAQSEQDENGMDFRRISEAINPLAKMLGLTLRSARGRSARR